MHPLMPPVLLRASRLNSFQTNAQAHPPHRQRAQATQAQARKGRPVVGADGLGHSMLTKGLDEQRPDAGVPRGFSQALATQQIAAVPVANRQGRAPLSAARAKVPFEITTPHLVGFLAMDQRLLTGHSPGLSFQAGAQSMTAQNLTDRALRRATLRANPLQKLFPQLGRSP